MKKMLRNSLIMSLNCLAVVIGLVEVVWFFVTDQQIFSPWGFYLFTFTLVTATHLNIQEKANKLPRTSTVAEVKVFAIMVGVIMICMLIDIWLTDGLNDWRIVVIVVSIVAIQSNLSHIFWQPESKEALKACMEKYIQAKVNSRQEKHYYKLLLRDFDDASTGHIYNNPYIWFDVIRSSVGSPISLGEDDLRKIEDVFLVILFSDEVLNELILLNDNPLSMMPSTRTWFDRVLRKKLLAS